MEIRIAKRDDGFWYLTLDGNTSTKFRTLVRLLSALMKHAKKEKL